MYSSSRQKFWRIPQDWRFPQGEDFPRSSRLWVYGVNLPSSPSVWWIFSSLTSNILPESFNQRQDWARTENMRTERGLRTWRLSWEGGPWAEDVSNLVPSPSFWGLLRTHARKIVLHWLYNREGTKVILPGLIGSPWQVSVGADLPIKPLSPPLTPILAYKLVSTKI